MMSVSGQLPAVDRLAERHPALKLVIDHLGLRSGTKGAQAFAGLPELLKLARHANVAVKASALPCYSVEAYPFRDVQRHIRSVHDTFGPPRLPCTCRRTVTFFTEELPWLSAGDQEWITGRGVCEWLGWPTPGAT
jgi:L-fuconolactonase